MIVKRIKNALRRIIRPPLHKPEISVPHVFLGTDYGGWPLLKSTPRGALVFSFGIGEDISFDLGAIKEFGCVVHGFDPTPRCNEWLKQQTLPEQFIFHPIGIAAEDGEAKFFPPLNDGHVSFSLQPAEGVDENTAITAQVLRLQTILNDLKTDLPIVLKMDIEGFEYPVIDDLIANALFPEQLVVEFHHKMFGIPNSQTLEAVEKLRAVGYQLYFVSSSGHEYGFFRNKTSKA